MAGLLWWSYFDRPLPAWEYGAEQLDTVPRGAFARDVWTLWHIPIVLGIIMAAAGLEEITLHPTDALPLAFRLLLAGGLVGFLGGIAGGIWRGFKVVGWERLTTIAVLVTGVLLLEVDEEYRSPLRQQGLMTRDPRKVERKKPGRPKARKRFQFSKR